MDLSTIQPIVLVGGRSSRFGRDKLRETVPTARAGGRPGEHWLVDIPVGALREVFGPRVGAVGACDPAVAARADLVIPDRYPGAGPAGGILSAIEACGDVFVLAGDLAAITPDTVRTVLEACRSAIAGIAPGEGALAVLATTDGSRVEPCIGIYRAAAAKWLRDTVAGGTPLHRAIPPNGRVVVAIDTGAARNINTPNDFGNQYR